jgi:hypothetical protein
MTEEEQDRHHEQDARQPFTTSTAPRAFGFDLRYGESRGEFVRANRLESNTPSSKTYQRKTRRAFRERVDQFSRVVLGGKDGPL